MLVILIGRKEGISRAQENAAVGGAEWASSGLCKADASRMRSRLILSSKAEQVEPDSYRHKLTFQSKVFGSTYVLADITPPIAAMPGSQLRILDQASLVVETETSEEQRLVVGKLQFSSSYLDSAANDYVAAGQLVGLYPIEGSSEITQTSEKLVTHDLDAGSYYAIDIHAAKDQDVRAFMSGIVVFQQDAYDDELSCGPEHAERYSNRLYVKQDDGFEALYGHLAQGTILVTEGQRIEMGQIIAKVGCFDTCFNTHLHFQIGGIDDEGYRSVPVKFFDQVGAAPWEPKAGMKRNL